MRLAILFFLALLSIGCGHDATPAAPTATAPATTTQATSAEANMVIKITLAADGKISADGHVVTLEQLGAKLTDLAKAGGEVWYHRENPESEPHPNAFKIMDLVAQNGLPIKLSAKPDFSDSVDEKGISHPGH